MFEDMKNLVNDLEEELTAQTTPDGVATRARDPQNLFGKYIKIQEIGEGGEGTIWKAFDRTLKRYVALKFIKPVADPESKTFKKEAEILANLEHPNIVPVFEIGREGNQDFIAMKYVEGRTLNRIADLLDMATKVNMFISICKAMHFAHEKVIIHRDIKPENILIDDDNNAYITDFGISMAFNPMRRKKAEIAGTVQYIPPEYLEGKQPDISGDIYSLGVTLYEFLTGTHPFEGNSDAEVMARITEGSYSAPSVINKEIPPDLEGIVMKAMDRNPSARHESCLALANDLEAFVSSVRKKSYLKSFINWKNIAIGIIILSFLLALALHLFRNYQEKEADVLFLRAYDYYEKNDLERAEILYKQGLELAPGNPQALNTLANIYSLTNQHEKAEQTLLHAISVNPAISSHRENLMALYIDTERYEEAVGVFRKYYNSEWDQPKAYTNLGIAYTYLGRYTEAEDAFRESILLDDNNPFAYTHLGYMFQLKGDKEKALEAYNRALMIDHYFMLARQYKIRLLADTGDTEGAIRLCKETIQLRPDIYEPYALLSTIYLVLRRAKDAVKTLEAAMEYPSIAVPAMTDLGILNVRLGDYRTAKEHLTSSLSNNPANVRAIYSLGITYILLNEKENATEQYARLVELGQQGIADKLMFYINNPGEIGTGR